MTYQNTEIQKQSIQALIIFCGLLMTLSGASTDIILPAFDVIARDLSISLTQVQLTLPAFALPFGIGQLIYGPMSDRYGRKPILKIGLALYLIGCALAALSSDLETLLVGRAFQGLGAGATPVLARAILRDTHEATALGRAMASSMAIFAIGPIAAPIAGYFLTEAIGWRSIFLATGLLGILLLNYTWARLRETNVAIDKDALDVRHLINSLLQILRHKQSRYFTLVAVIAYFPLFNYITHAPLLFENAYGVSGLMFVSLFALTGFGIIIGQITNRNLLPKLGALTMLRISSAILLCSSLVIYGLNSSGLLGPFSLTVLMLLFNTSFLPVVSNCASLALDPHPKIAGFMSSFFGFATNAGAAVFVLITIPIVQGEPVIWSIVMVLTTALTAGLIWAAKKSSVSF